MPKEEETKETKKRYAEFVAKVWADEELRQRLKADPATVLKEFGFKVPEGKHVKIIEVDAEKTVYFILPTKPDVLVELVIEPPCVFFHLCH